MMSAPLRPPLPGSARLSWNSNRRGRFRTLTWGMRHWPRICGRGLWGRGTPPRDVANMSASARAGGQASPEAFLAELEAVRPGIHLGLGNSLELLARVGCPQKALRVVHVAGTNGKGSVCAMVSAALRAAGKRVGVYNSPHLFHWSDAVLIDGEPDEAGWRASMGAIQAALGDIDGARGRYTAFEASCAAMWLQLATAKVDYAVIEAGVGGLRDATNVCDTVSASVLTSVGLDHQQLLGDTIAEIAQDKCGIFKPRCPAVVSSVVPEEAMSVARATAAHQDSPLIIAPPATRVYADGAGCGQGRLRWRGADSGPGGDGGGELEFELQLMGDVQLINAGVAAGVLRQLQRTDTSLTDDHLRQGLASARWPGRMEPSHWLGTDMLLDGAHNPEAALALGAYMDTLRVRKEVAGVHWIIGMSAGKDVEGVVRGLVRPGDVVGCVPVESLPQRYKTASPSRILQAAQAAGATGREHPCLRDALVFAVERCGGTGVQLVLCGSLHLVADFRRLKGRE